MLCWILIAGGLLIMVGQHDRSEALFYYFRLEDQVPETHLLRLIDKHISFEFVRRQLKDSRVSQHARVRQAQRQRKKVEALFAELKNQIGLRRLRLRRLRFVREQFFLAAVAQNIKRLVRFLGQPTAPVLPATT
jgi:IS4 transposase